MAKRNMTTALCRYLRTHHAGRNNATSSKTLEVVFGVNGATIRKMVNALRCGGFPVCSNADGYYYAAAKSEISATIAQLGGRIRSISNAKKGLLASMDVFSSADSLDESACISMNGGRPSGK